MVLLAVETPRAAAVPLLQLALSLVLLGHAQAAADQLITPYSREADRQLVQTGGGNNNGPTYAILTPTHPKRVPLTVDLVEYILGGRGNNGTCRQLSTIVIYYNERKNPHPRVPPALSQLVAKYKGRVVVEVLHPFAFSHRFRIPQNGGGSQFFLAHDDDVST